MTKLLKLLTIPEVAEALGVTVSCLRRWVLERKISTIRIGRLVRISPAELERIVRAGIVPARPDRGRSYAE
jgi:excisionase family DNA binding protein